MTNPNNSIGTNGAFGGRTSVNAFNDIMGAFSRGLVSGWACNPNSGLTVSIGGDGVHRDVAIAEDNAGNKTSINNISNSPVNVTIGAAPGTNSRIDAIVAYVDNPPSGTATVTDNPSACGLIVVQGTTSLAPINPSDAQIRTAITADGASGTTAYYVVLAYITMASGTTDITSGEIAAGDKATLEANLDVNSVGTDSIEDRAVNADKIDFSTLSGNYSSSEVATEYTWIDGKTIYKKTVSKTPISPSSSNAVDHGIIGLDSVVSVSGVLTVGSAFYMLPRITSSSLNQTVMIQVGNTKVEFAAGSDASFDSGTVTMYYTKNS